MLAALGLSALVAVLAVLVGGTQNGQWIWHIIVAGVTTGLMAAASKMVDRPKTRFTGLFAIAALLIEFILVAAAIWAATEQVATIALAFFLSAFPGIAFFHAAQTRTGRRAGLTGLGLACTILVLFLIAGFENGQQLGDMNVWELAWEWWLTCICVVLCLGGWGADQRHWRWLGVGAALAAFIITTDIQYTHQVWPVPEHRTIILISIALVVTQANLTLLLDAPSQFFILRFAAIALGMAAAGVWVWSTYQDSNAAWQMTPAQRLSIALAICAGSATLAVGITGRFNRKSDPVKATIEFKEIAIVCPHCGKKQSMPLGESVCGDCGLRFSIGVTEPRCPNCSYLLLMNKSERCPECGTDISAPPTVVPGAG
jgi:hypothetical protein